MAPELILLQRRAYRVEAELIGDDRIPQLTESVAELLEAGLVWQVVCSDRQVIAALAFAVEDGVIDIDRLVVDPAWHRHGLGRALVMALPSEAARVSTGRGNAPARALYQKLRFTHLGDREVIPGLWVSDYSR
ncbi:GNAT family N-acetyltransferase [Tersicoccus solisilvae]|uniref:GNAT family N-acetyltransferase n=1 Tax=Tersicoccus solisilvae TaxID=1882339 RepID=UPI001666E979|nr:GNAT family N-acetyltransferase [Tersicoccus solisilvae]